jgi:hypothetical protein
MSRLPAILALATGLGLLAAPAAALAAASRYGDPVAYCAAIGTIDRPDSRYGGPKVPVWMAEALRRAADGAASAPLEVFERARWRCAAGKVLACLYGANIPCDEKADARRRPSAGARRFCRDEPDAAVVPAYAAGRRTIYEWRCRAGRPAVARKLETVDRQGYARRFWYEVAPQ